MPALGTAITALRSMSLEQALDLALAKLKTISSQPASVAADSTRVIRLAPARQR
jgi:hypothetical protein